MPSPAIPPAGIAKLHTVERLLAIALVLGFAPGFAAADLAVEARRPVESVPMRWAPHSRLEPAGFRMPAQEAYAPRAARDNRAHWYCWLRQPSTAISCLLEAAPASVDANGVDFGSLARLPAIVTDMRTAPQRLRGQQIDIPLFAPPITMDFAAQLAGSIMCGSQRACTVVFAEHADHARISALHEPDGQRAGLAPLD